MLVKIVLLSTVTENLVYFNFSTKCSSSVFAIKFLLCWNTSSSRAPRFYIASVSTCLLCFIRSDFPQFKIFFNRQRNCFCLNHHRKIRANLWNYFIRATFLQSIVCDTSFDLCSPPRRGPNHVCKGKKICININLFLVSGWTYFQQITFTNSQ